MTRFALFAVLLAGCATESAPEYTLDQDSLAKKANTFCGGIAGIQCPDGQVCVDDPSDSCDPNNGGADCGGVCRNGGGNGGNGGNGGGPCHDTDTETYVGCGDECAVIRFTCAEGYEYFADNKGCGCQLMPTCGDTFCGTGEYCCNDSCGICAPEGGFCTQQVCADTTTL